MPHNKKPVCYEMSHMASDVHEFFETTYVTTNVQETWNIKCLDPLWVRFTENSST
jgi:hypothetical protein